MFASLKPKPKSKWHIAPALIAGIAIGSLSSMPAFAVAIDIEVSEKGEPLPDIQISFETSDGEAIELDEELEQVLLEDLQTEEEPKETADSSSTEEPVEETPEEVAEAPADASSSPDKSDRTDIVETPKPRLAKTNKDGIATARLPDSVTGQDVVMIIRQGDLVLRRESIIAEEIDQPIKVPAFDPAAALISVAFDQPEKCKAGQDCELVLTQRNEGDGIYRGPLILSHKLPGNWQQAQDLEAAWSCGRGGSGQTLCSTDAVLQPGEETKHRFVVKLPQRVSTSQRCAEVLPLDGQNERNVIAAVQHGLEKAGHGAGSADGVSGRKTKAAIASYSETQPDGSFAGEPTFPELFASLYGTDLDDIARLGVAAQTQCLRLALIAPPKTIKKATSARQTTKKTVKTVKKKTTRTVKKTTKKVKKILRKAPVTFSIGIRVGGKRHKKKHHYPKKELY